MRVRGLDANGDFMFGKGKSDYKYDVNALAQIIQTRLKSILNDCFFAANDGIDWFNLMGSKELRDLRLAVASCILNTEGVSTLAEVNLNINQQRMVTIQYAVISVYGEISRTVSVGEQNA